MFICCAFWTYIGKPFKKPIYYNPWMMVLLALDIIVGVAFYFITPLKVFGMLRLGITTGGALLGITLATLFVHLLYTLMTRGLSARTEANKERSTHPQGST